MTKDQFDASKFTEATAKSIDVSPEDIADVQTEAVPAVSSARSLLQIDLKVLFKVYVKDAEDAMDVSERFTDAVEDGTFQKNLKDSGITGFTGIKAPTVAVEQAPPKEGGGPTPTPTPTTKAPTTTTTKAPTTTTTKAPTTTTTKATTKASSSATTTTTSKAEVLASSPPPPLLSATPSTPSGGNSDADKNAGMFVGIGVAAGCVGGGVVAYFVTKVYLKRKLATTTTESLSATLA